MKIKKELQAKERGITLIALVITIIILLILAGITIGLVTGDNGLLTQATKAQEKTTQAQEEENIKLAIMASSIEDNGYAEILDEESFEKELKNVFGNQELNVTSNGDGSFLITIDDRKYYVNDDKTVISNDNIIEVGTVEELKAFRDDVNSGNTYEGKTILLTSDITLSEEWEPIGFIAPDTDIRNPETENNKPFKGIFDGGNNTIDNMIINSTNSKYNGLFSFVVDGTIRNITIGNNSEITGSPGAGVVGFLYGFKGNISNCINYSNANCAGIALSIDGQHIIYNCKNYGNLTRENGAASGIVSSSNGSDWEQFTNVTNTIINCVNYGNIIANGNYCGGIAGYFLGNILNSCNKGNVTSTGIYTGGIAGCMDGNIKNCYNLGNISGNNYVGGIKGMSDKGISDNATVVNCYSVGEINSIIANEGDIAGYIENNPEIINCYTKNDTFTAKDLGDAFVDDTENVNGGYPLLYWE